jgi:hypothetical protein
MLLMAVCMTMAFGSVFLAALAFPNGYNWHSQVISKLTSPKENPAGYWLPVAGISISTLLALPFAGYIAAPLIEISPRLARAARMALWFGFAVISLAMVVQVLDTIVTHRKAHTYLAHAATFVFFIGMGLCSVCAACDRNGRKILPKPVAPCWMALTFGPMLLLVPLAIVSVLGKSGFAWAEQFRQSFRSTPLWHLAFWEWTALAICSAFVIISTIYLPEPRACAVAARRTKTSPSLAKADAY